MVTERIKPTEKTHICELLAQGKCLAFPTDTVYGLGVVYDNEEALNNLKAAKGRPDHKPIPMMVGSLAQLKEVAILPQRFERIAQTFMPGALTLICRKKAGIADFVSNGFDTLAIRIPNDPLLLEVMCRLGKPLLVSSANLSDHQPGFDHFGVLEQLDGRIDGIVEGRVSGGVPSTIIDTTKEGLVVVREGVITKEQLEEKMMMKIAIGCDHGALEYKNMIVKMLENEGHRVIDHGTYTHNSVDYVDYAHKVCESVQTKEVEKGIVLCGTGIGVSIAANKHDGIRCALVSDLFTAKVTREHNDSNVLALGQRVLGEEIAKEIVRTWLHTPFSNDERHLRRIEKISDLEKEC